jgi:O-acetylhomoserine (thiol)-lyase
VVVDSGNFQWDNGKFPFMTEPVAAYGDLEWWGNFGEYGFLTKLRSEQLRDIGPTLSPMAAFQLLQGIETLPQRMKDHVANAKAVAEWLDSDKRVSWISYSGLKSHPDHKLAKKYAPEGPGSVFSFGVEGGRKASEKLINNVQLISHLANIGDAKSLIIHPASTLYRQLGPDQLAAAGVPEDLIRISVGIEDIEDILWDLDQALEIATGRTR